MPLVRTDTPRTWGDEFARPGRSITFNPWVKFLDLQKRCDKTPRKVEILDQVGLAIGTGAPKDAARQLAFIVVRVSNAEGCDCGEGNASQFRIIRVEIEVDKGKGKSRKGEPVEKLEDLPDPPGPPPGFP